MNNPPGIHSDHRVALLHNRYRRRGGEERFVDQLVELFSQRGLRHVVLERDSTKQNSKLGNLRAGGGLVAGGSGTRQVGKAVSQLGATVLHAHNIYPTFGVRSLAAARAAGAAVILHVHNYRLFCATGTAFRDGRDCEACAPRRTWNGVRYNCRESRAEAGAYGVGLGLHQAKLQSTVDLFVAPTQSLADDLTRLGAADSVSVLPSALPSNDFVESSRAGDGTYGLFAARAAPEKGLDVAIAAASASGVPLRVAGDGPMMQSARSQATQLSAPVEFLGVLNRAQLSSQRAGAAFAIFPSLWREVLPLASLEAMAGGLPLIASDAGGLSDLAEPNLRVPRGDVKALATTMRALFDDPAARQAAGERALARVRAEHDEDLFFERLNALYDRAVEKRAAAK